MKNFLFVLISITIAGCGGTSGDLDSLSNSKYSSKSRIEQARENYTHGVPSNLGSSREQFQGDTMKY